MLGTLEDKSYHLRFELEEITKIFETLFGTSILGSKEGGFPTFESKDGLCYFGELSVGYDEGVFVKNKGKKYPDDLNKGFLHTHIKHEAYPSRDDLERMERTGPDTPWLIVGINLETKRAIFRGYHSKFLSPTPDTERVLLYICDKMCSEIKYDERKLTFFYQEKEEVGTLIKNHLSFLKSK